MIQEIYDKQKVYEMGLDAIAYQDKDKLIQALNEGFTLNGFFRTQTNNQINNDFKRSYYYSEEHKNLLPFLKISREDLQKVSRDWPSCMLKMVYIGNFLNILCL